MATTTARLHAAPHGILFAEDFDEDLHGPPSTDASRSCWSSTGRVDPGLRTRSRATRADAARCDWSGLLSELRLGSPLPTSPHRIGGLSGVSDEGMARAAVTPSSPSADDASVAPSAAEASETVRVEAASAAALREAWDAGRREGLAAARTKHEALLAEALGHLPAALASACARAERTAHEAAAVAATSLARLLVAVLRTASLAHRDRTGEAETQAVALALLPSLGRAGPVIMRIAPTCRDAAASVLETMDERVRAGVRLIACDDLAPGDVRIDWEDGWSTRSAARVWDDIDAVLDPLGLSAPPRDAERPPAAGLAIRAGAGDGAGDQDQPNREP